MNLAPLPSIILATAEQRSPNAVLTTIIDSVARQPGVALARLWLRQADADCPHCSSSGEMGGESLHLRASAGTPQIDATDWSRTDGTFHRIPLDRGDLKISHIGTSGQSVRIPRLSEDRQWVRNPEWARCGSPDLFARYGGGRARRLPADRAGR